MLDRISGSVGDDGPFLRLLQILAPNPTDKIAVLEAYFDESGTHDGSPVLTMAGFLFDSQGAARLHKRWMRVLARHNLPHFHMVDNVSGNDIHKDLSDHDRILLQVRLIALIKYYALFGFAVSLDERKFKSWFPSGRFLPNAYSMACWQCVSAVQAWMQAAEHEGPVSFFFEAGHKHQGEANRAMARLFGDTIYGSHTFIRKEYAAAIQAADILAYLHGKHVKDMLSGKERLRADYQALLAGPDCLAMLNNGDRIYDTQTFRITKPRRVQPLSGKATGRMLLPFRFRSTL